MAQWLLIAQDSAGKEMSREFETKSRARAWFTKNGYASAKLYCTAAHDRHAASMTKRQPKILDLYTRNKG